MEKTEDQLLDAAADLIDQANQASGIEPTGLFV